VRTPNAFKRSADHESGTHTNVLPVPYPGDAGIGWPMACSPPENRDVRVHYLSIAMDLRMKVLGEEYLLGIDWMFLSPIAAIVIMTVDLHFICTL
jgi:hypothetical protein